MTEKVGVTITEVAEDLEEGAVVTGIVEDLAFEGDLTNHSEVTMGAAVEEILVTNRLIRETVLDLNLRKTRKLLLMIRWISLN